MQVKIWMTTCAMMLLPATLTGVANANHGRLLEPATQLEIQADVAASQIDQVFRHSKLLRAMNNEVYGVMDAASDVRQLVRINANCARIRGKVFVAEARLRTLNNLVSVAERHARLGIDPPLCGCVEELYAQLDSMRATVRCLKNLANDLRPVHQVRRVPVVDPYHRPPCGTRVDPYYGVRPPVRHGQVRSGGTFSSGGFRIHFNF